MIIIILPTLKPKKFTQVCIRLRKISGLNQHELAVKAGISRPAYAAESEPEGPVKAEMAGNRLYSLVRSAYNKELISLSRSAEILEKTQDEMRELALAWRGELWH